MNLRLLDQCIVNTQISGVEPRAGSVSDGFFEANRRLRFRLGPDFSMLTQLRDLDIAWHSSGHVRAPPLTERAMIEPRASPAKPANLGGLAISKLSNQLRRKNGRVRQLGGDT